MKRITLLTLFAGFFVMAFVATSCDKVKELASFKVSINSPEHRFVLDSANFLTKASMEETLLTSQHITVNIDSVLNANGVSSATITNGTLTNVVMAIVAPEGTNFDWLSSARVTASTSLENLANGTEVAHTGTIEAGSTSITFILDNAAITQYINNNNFYIGLYGTLAGPLPASQITLSLNSTVVFTINPLGE